MFLLFAAALGGQSDGHYFGGQPPHRSPWWMGYNARPSGQRQRNWLW